MCGTRWSMGGSTSAIHQSTANKSLAKLCSIWQQYTGTFSWASESVILINSVNKHTLPGAGEGNVCMFYLLCSGDTFVLQNEPDIQCAQTNRPPWSCFKPRWWHCSRDSSVVQSISLKTTNNSRISIKFWFTYSHIPVLQLGPFIRCALSGLFSF